VKRGACFKEGINTVVYINIISNKEGFISLAIKIKEKKKVIKYIKAIRVKGVYKRLKYNININ
jgi:hypothetical protein